MMQKDTKTRENREKIIMECFYLLRRWQQKAVENRLFVLLIDMFNIRVLISMQKKNEIVEEKCDASCSVQRVARVSLLVRKLL